MCARSEGRNSLQFFNTRSLVFIAKRKKLFLVVKLVQKAENMEWVFRKETRKFRLSTICTYMKCSIGKVGSTQTIQLVQ